MAKKKAKNLAAAVVTTPGTAAQPTAGTQLSARNGAAKLSPAKVLIELPMLKLAGDDGQQQYSQRRLEMTLPVEEAGALRSVFDGLVHSGAFKGVANPTPQDAIRYLLRRAAEAHAKTV